MAILYTSPSAAPLPGLAQALCAAGERAPGLVCGGALTGLFRNVWGIAIASVEKLKSIHAVMCSRQAKLSSYLSGRSILKIAHVAKLRSSSPTA